MNRMWLTELHFLTRAVLLLAAVATGICQAASITLSGRVMDKDGAAIAGASVVICSSGTEILTDTDGSFLLEKSEAGISATDFFHTVIPRDGRIVIQNGKIRVNTTKSATALSVKDYGMNGRLLFQNSTLSFREKTSCHFRYEAAIFISAGLHLVITM